MTDSLNDSFVMRLIVYDTNDDPMLTIRHTFENTVPQEATRGMLRLIRDIRNDNPQIPNIMFRADLKDSEGNTIFVYDDD